MDQYQLGQQCKKCSARLYCNNCPCSMCGADNTIKENNTEEETVSDAPVSPPEAQNKMPSMFKQAKNFATSAAKHIANGGQNVPENLKNARLEICGGCDKLSGDRCSACGCIVSIKAAWASEECPIGKWERYEQTRGKCGGCGGK